MQCYGLNVSGILKAVRNISGTIGNYCVKFIPSGAELAELTPSRGLNTSLTSSELTPSRGLNTSWQQNLSGILGAS